MSIPGGARRDAITVRAFDAQDEPAVLELLQMTFGRWPSIDDITPSAFFRWKHAACPFGPSSMLIAEIGGVIVGFQAYMPWRFHAGGRTIAAVRGVDLAVDPSYRRRGVAASIRAAARFSEDIAFLWGNPSAASPHRAVREGGRSVIEVPRFLHPCSPLRAIRRGLRRSAVLERLPIDAPSAAEILRDDEEMEPLLAHIGGRGERLSTVRDLEYLRWRYGQFAAYRAIRIGRGTDDAGLVIFSPRQHGSWWVLHVCEFLVPRDDPRTARRLLHSVKNASPADFIRCCFDSRRQALRSGFAELRHKDTLTVLPLRDGLLPDPRRGASWALSAGDLDLL
jgi:GNAT superfamily N-acetyltransferase